MGFVHGWERGAGGISFFHNPQDSFFAEGDFLNRIDVDDYALWGRDPAVDPNYGTFCMIGVQFLIADIDINTPEFPTYLKGWTEDPNRPNFPDVPGFDLNGGGSNFMFLGPVPPNEFSVTQWALTFVDPVCVQTEGDIFLGVNIGPVGGGEGLLVPFVGDADTPIFNLTTWDDPGPAAAGIAEGSYVCIVPTQTNLGGQPIPTGAPASYTFYRVQNYFEIYLENASGGVCTAVTNQPSFDVSSPSNGNGTSNFLSGLHPDAGNFPVNPGRNQAPPTGWTGDRLGYVYSDHRLTDGDPVFVVISLRLNNPPFPLVNVLGGVGHTGQVLVEILDHVVVASGTATTVSVPEIALNYGVFETSFDLPTQLRAFLALNSVTINWQGLGLDGAFNIHATGLARQKF